MAEQINILIYDAECRLCVSAKEIMERWDAKRRLRFLPFQDPEAFSLVPDLPKIGCLNAMRVIDQKGRVSIGIDALRAILYLLPGGFIIARLSRLPGVYFVAENIYFWIARNRYRLLGAARSQVASSSTRRNQ
ncbi:MAG: DUF393 domain-containing protein [Nitrospirota bacterium]